jgi:hypothetical protein
MTKTIKCQFPMCSSQTSVEEMQRVTNTVFNLTGTVYRSDSRGVYVFLNDGEKAYWPSAQIETISVEQPQAGHFICSRHTDDELRAVGILKTERTDKEVHFQTVAFDRKLDGKFPTPKNPGWTHPLPEVPDLYQSGLDNEDLDEVSAGVVEIPFDDESK